MNHAVLHRGRPWSAHEYGTLAMVVGLAIWAVRAELADIIWISIRDAEQSHILLAPVVAAWLLYLRRGRLKYVRYRPSMSGLALIAFSWVMIWTGYGTSTMVLQHLGALLAILGAVMTVTGTQILRQFTCVLVVLIFFVPVPGAVRQAIALPLQYMAATVTQFILELVGVSSVQTGNTLEVNGTQVAVGEACNGMRMVFAFTLVVYAFVFSVPLRWSVKRALLVLSPVVALLCNVVRLVPTALVYGYGTVDAAEHFHDLAGWIMLPIALGLMMGLLSLFDWMGLPVRQWRLAQ